MPALKADANTTIWAAAPGTGMGGNLGKDSRQLIGHYGSVPIAQPTITVANSGAGTAGAILVALGLARQIP